MLKLSSAMWELVTAGNSVDDGVEGILYTMTYSNLWTWRQLSIEYSWKLVGLLKNIFQAAKQCKINVETAIRKRNKKY